MPFTSGKLKGQLTAAEIRKLIRGHNKLVSITIPPRTNRDGLIKLIEDNGYKLDHKKQAIIDAKKSRPRRPKVTLDQAKELTKPKEKTALQKQKAKEKKEEKQIQKKKEVRQIKKEAVKKEKEVQKKKKKDIKDKLLSNNNNRKKKMPTISTQTETPKKKQVLKLPSQKPKKVTIDKSKKPPMNAKKIVPKKKKEAPKPKKEEIPSDFTWKEVKNAFKLIKKGISSLPSDVRKNMALRDVGKLITSEKPPSEWTEADKKLWRGFFAVFDWSEALEWLKYNVGYKYSEREEKAMMFLRNGFAKTDPKKEEKKKKGNLRQEVLLHAVTGLKEISEEHNEPDKDMKKQIRELTTIFNTMKKGKFAGFTNQQRKWIKQSLETYLDQDFADPDEEDEHTRELVKEAKKLVPIFSGGGEKKKEAKKKPQKPITLNITTLQYLARIFADAMDEIMGTNEVNKNKELYHDIKFSKFSGDKLFKLLNSKSKTNEKKRKKIIEALKYWARDLVGDKYKPKNEIDNLYDIDDDGNIPLGIKFNQFEKVGDIDDKELKQIGDLVETFTPYKMETKKGEGFDDQLKYRFVGKS
jgi:hypothetical protein